MGWERASLYPLSVEREYTSESWKGQADMYRVIVSRHVITSGASRN